VPFGELDEPVPTKLTKDEFVLRPIRADDAEWDYDAVMETREFLRKWQQSPWPEDDFTVDANRADLVALEERHAAHRAFTYTVLDPSRSECLGCVYIFPISATFLAESAVARVGEDEWSDVDAVVFFWVRRSRVESGMDRRLLGALRVRFAVEWNLERVVYVTNEQVPDQADLFAGSDLVLKFQILEPGKLGQFLAFGSTS
jgi:hypothetical protein